MLVAPRPRSRVISRNLNSLSLQNLCRGRSITAAALHAAIYALICCARQQLLRPGTTRSSVRSVFCQRLSSKMILAPIGPAKCTAISPKVSPGFVMCPISLENDGRAQIRALPKPELDCPRHRRRALFCSQRASIAGSSVARKTFRSAGYRRIIAESAEAR